MLCSRCGQEGPTEYGPDGQSYCSSCAFYGMNKPCWKCRMYLPSLELQQWRGQWTCQYCMMDLRDEERRIEKRHERQETPITVPGQGGGEYVPAKPMGFGTGGMAEAHAEGERRLDFGAEQETCDRCKRKLTMVYIINGKKFCEVCMESEKKNWERADARPMIVRFRAKGNEGLLVNLLRKMGVALGEYIRKKREEKLEKEKTVLWKKELGANKNAENKDNSDNKNTSDNKEKTKKPEESEKASVIAPVQKKKHPKPEFEKHHSDAENSEL
ncbi:TPA: hypothetical protein HA238_03320 [Candidatus Micrarchaeota archaeon]|nr:hypothetical protein [Candidatus Micrarchaeota archaeon]